jgi:hypothetical protein
MDREDDYIMLRFDFEKEAGWRLEAAAKDRPGELQRAQAAAALLEHLADTTGDVALALIREYHDLIRGETELALHSKRLRQIGIEYFPSTAEEFVRDGIMLLSRRPGG